MYQKGFSIFFINIYDNFAGIRIIIFIYKVIRMYSSYHIILYYVDNLYIHRIEISTK